ncbi:N-acetylglucosaminyldiphosphodolichol N-acetylglucosaminyltransferase anchoring subunit ALG14 SCDLUD_003716 [Saccharomycodes ludwigii]|uniref:N-acetylglucosaminyldiphosphodolichol N-acetylglucosaminyltransferase anchoring subunit ALG14 n=1 Tax=Saccharomycodes ludwigii TaxID=36035 RepID=UPI001E8313AF|nr:hypothetical protein SCDLUD_003716 [Saccharomycodes ludwigii]KAH3900714.1 hypothetical protein SCDLUD_003716 [Saccharomycodes ludwigii]
MNSTNIWILILSVLVIHFNITIIKTFKLFKKNITPLSSGSSQICKGETNSNNNNNNKIPKRVIVYLGSGGHTGEMIRLLKNYPVLFKSKEMIVTYSDGQSYKNFKKTFCSTAAKDCTLSNIKYIRLYKAREVGANVFSSFKSIILTNLIILFKLTPLAIKLVLLSICSLFSKEKNPSDKTIILLNGPGTCCLLSVFFKMIQFIINFVIVAKSGNIKIIYVESLARVKKLSLTGKILYYFGLADEFIVQWPELHRRLDRSKYYGIIV